MRVAAALGLALPLAAAKVSYDGYKAFHIDTPEDFDDVQAKLKDITYTSMDCGNNHKGFDIAVSPESLKAFEKLNLNSKVMHEDLGASMTEEGKMSAYVRKYIGSPMLGRY